MLMAEDCTYEKIYFSLWETGQRYGDFVQFRIIGKSHDDRLIPMIEVGKGENCIFCISGIEAGDGKMPAHLVEMALDYCRSYESGWLVNEDYDVRKLLDRVRICFIPILNPDGYEVTVHGYGAIRNPIFRQMLKMQNRPLEEFNCNARGVVLKKNFPTNYYQRRKIYQEPASENETKALINIFQQYKSEGLITFSFSQGKIIYCRQDKGHGYNQKNYRMARHLQKCSGYHVEKGKINMHYRGDETGQDIGSPEQFYAEVIRQPSLAVEIPVSDEENDVEKMKKEYGKISLLPLEYIYSLS